MLKNTFSYRILQANKKNVLRVIISLDRSHLQVSYFFN